MIAPGIPVATAISPYDKSADVTGSVPAGTPGTPPVELGPIRTAPKKRKAHTEPEDLYAPLGIRAGAFDLFPAIEFIGGPSRGLQALLIGSLKIGFGVDDYVGNNRVDNRYSAGAGLTYKLNRTVQIKGEFRPDWLQSNTAGADYTASIFMLGLRVQR